MIRKAINENGIEREYVLSKCPFCGKDIARLANCIEVSSCASWSECKSAKYTTVVCSFKDGGCGSSVGFYPTVEQAAEAWNRRAQACSGLLQKE